MMVDVHVIRLASLLVLCLHADVLSAAPPVYEPVLADGGTSAALRLPGDLAGVPAHRLSLEKAPPGAYLTRDGSGERILRWPLSPGDGAETEIVLASTVGEEPVALERHRLRVRWGGRMSAPDPAAVPVPVAAGSTRTATQPDGRAEWRPRRSSVRTLGASRPDVRTSDVRMRPARATAEPATRRGNAAPELGHIGPQRLVVGRRWQLHVRVRDADGDEPVFFTAGLPETATFRNGRDGWLVLGWTPTAASVGQVDVTLGVADGRDSRLRTERVVRLDVLPATGTAGDTVPLASAPAEPPASAPVIEPLAAQVVSTGRTVSFRVVARLDDGRRPHLLIDRLPRRAGFYENVDGSRTFHWPTQSSDQGEHLFSVTAVHPDDDALRSRVETLVIVGDPTLARTTPSQPNSPFGVATSDTVYESAANDPPYHAPPADAYWPDSPRAERYDPGVGRGRGEGAGLGEVTFPAGSYDDGGFSSEDMYFEESDPYPEYVVPFEDASYFDGFDYVEEEPETGYAHPGDGREYFLGEDGMAVDADGNPVGEFRFRE